MGGVDKRDHERSNRIATVILRVGEDSQSGIEESGFNIAGDIGVEAGEDNIAVLEVLGFTGGNGKGSGGSRNRRGLFPADGFGVELAGGTWGGADGGEGEGGVGREEEDEALSDGAGGAEDTNFAGRKSSGHYGLRN